MPRAHRGSSLVALALFLALSAVPAGAGETEGVTRTIHVPPGWEGAYDFGYAPAVRVGDTVIVSGIPAAGEGTYEEKIRRMYRRAEELLRSAGAEIEDVVEVSTFHAEPEDGEAFREEFDRYMPIHREFFGEHRPAWTAVGTTALLAPGAPVEMRLLAVVGSGAKSRVERTAAGDGSAEPPRCGSSRN